MRIVLNGETTEVPEGLSVRGLLEHLRIAAPRVAVEVNRAIVRRDLHDSHRLADGDRIEVVTFVGGG
jgi:thiamine biosynthesis protein ThiS